MNLEDTQRTAARQLRRQLGEERPVWIAASTHEGEDDALLAAHHQLVQRHPKALLILVPRHPERFDSVARLVAQHGFSYLRRSADATAGMADSQVLLGDTMGELLVLLGSADIAFIGGSLVERGGHNSLEAAAWGLPIITGHSDFNFADISQRLQQAGALEKTDCDGLGPLLQTLFDDAQRRHSMGRAARAVMDSNRGALASLIDEINTALEHSSAK